MIPAKGSHEKYATLIKAALEHLDIISPQELMLDGAQVI